MDTDAHLAVAANQRNWDDRADVHAASRFYDPARYRADPGHLSPTVSFDRTRVGDVAGLRLVHLQCHIGTDTLSWARLGAKVTGLDFSDRSLAVARDLFAATGTAGTFVQADVFDARDALDGDFDVVYTGIGALPWLPDIRRWAQTVAALLRPGGRLHVREDHPVASTLDEIDDGALVVRRSYFPDGTPTRSDEAATHTDGDHSVITHTENYLWQHTLGDVLSSLLAAGLRITAFEEHPFADWKALGPMVERDGFWWLPPGREDMLPLTYTVTARRD